MADNKKMQQDENAIDQLNSNLTRAGMKVEENKKVIFWAIGGILVVAAFVCSYFFIFRNPKLNKADEAFNKVEMTAANDTVAAQEYAKAADEYSGTDAGRNAALAAAESYYSIGKYQDAVKYLEKFSSGDEVLEANAKVLLGDCYVNLKKYPEAIEAFKDAVKKADGNPQIAPRALMKQAVVYDEQKKYADALACYETIQKDYPNFMAGNVEIEAYIEREKARLGK